MSSQTKARLVATVLVRVAVGLFATLLVAGLGVAVAWWAGAFEERIEPGSRQVSGAWPGLLKGHVPEKVHLITQNYYAESVGTLKAASRTEISARVMAEITKIHVRAGDVVQKGDVVIELDREALERRQSQAEAAMAATDAAVVQAKANYDRAEELRQENSAAISKQQTDQYAFQFEAARAKQSGAKEALAEAEVLLSYATISAPKAGKIVERLAEEGDVTQPGVPLLELYDPTSLRLEVPVMEHLAVKLKEGDELKVMIDALDNREFAATVDEIVPQAEAASRSLMVKVKLPPSPDFIEGMFGRLMIPAGPRDHLCLNTNAIERIGQLEFVYVVDADGQNPERRLIKTGRFGRPERVEVLSGLEANECVLVKANEAEENAESTSPKG